ncbi:MAG: hypothetical protein IJ560_02570 [Alphaproteobacteria bacterium]|nr:hypothetical protein [Alphaproteobacteria bacterium]
MNMRHKINYDYSYKLYSNNYDCSENAFVKLPTGVTLEQFIETLTRQNLTDVYKVCVLRTKTIVDMRTTKSPVVYSDQKKIDLFIDDAVHSGLDVQRNAAQRYKEFVHMVPALTRSDISPVVTTSSSIMRHNAVCGGGYIRTGRDAVEYRAPREESWNERVIFVRALNSMYDLLVNKQIQQIWPKRTDAIPLRLKQFFQYAK